MKDLALFPFRTVVWLAWMTAALGVLLYARHIWLLAQHMTGDAPPGLVAMLWWDVLYLLAAGLTLGAATGALLWRAWARRMLRWIAFVLAAYLLARGIMLFVHWQGSVRDNADLIARAPDADSLRIMVAQVTRTVWISLVLQTVMAALLAWLGWRLGTASIRTRFDGASRAG